MAEIWTVLGSPEEELSVRIMGGSFVLGAIWRLFNLRRKQYCPFTCGNSMCVLEGRTFTTQGTVCSRGSKRPNLALRDLCHLNHKLLVCFSHYFPQCLETHKHYNSSVIVQTILIKQDVFLKKNRKKSVWMTLVLN